MTPDSTTLGISICICTYRRKDGLARALESLRGLRMPANTAVEVVVVDNDAEASAQALVLALRAEFPLPLNYFCEPRSGVSHARNRCVVEAKGDWIAFIDDDEYAEPGWLCELCTLAMPDSNPGASPSAIATPIDGVFGPVLADFEATPPAWLLASGAHQRPRYPTGAVMSWGDCRSGNVIFRRRLFIAQHGFDARFAATGGEDVDFFWRCRKAGANLIWCDSAIVHESVPAQRLTRAWLLRRAFAGGRTFARLRGLHRGAWSYAPDAAWGLANVLVYTPLALWGRLVGLPRRFAYERKVAGGLGMLLALGLLRTGGEYGTVGK
ncbi:glycosyltransferase family 2 protein [Roseateles oligotrophus]|uniref:Glycosyltransferase family 2 protein n=1 Tax=Roseateles oligotrophus TaxID=1769250 RepID=A0ABT2YJD2_9BURK|nr:glycosyltransferase family A protein [Roseateles oligotrophus]MCV2370155.1 glycosyltransferase family 2 protein [Roseateles oligotrophus]